MRIARTTALATIGIVGSGVVGGLTYAAVSSPAAAAPSVAKQASVTEHAASRHGHRWLSRLEHGEVTVQTRAGDRTLDLQRGTVTAVSPTSISVRSHDGFTAAYDVTAKTRVRTRGALTTIAKVHTGDIVLVVGTSGKALRVLDRAA